MAGFVQGLGSNSEATDNQPYVLASMSVFNTLQRFEEACGKFSPVGERWGATVFGKMAINLQVNVAVRVATNSTTLKNVRPARIGAIPQEAWCRLPSQRRPTCCHCGSSHTRSHVTSAISLRLLYICHRPRHRNCDEDRMGDASC